MSFAAPNYAPYRVCLAIVNIARLIGCIIRGSKGHDFYISGTPNTLFHPIAVKYFLNNFRITSENKSLSRLYVKPLRPSTSWLTFIYLSKNNFSVFSHFFSIFKSRINLSLRMRKAKIYHEGLKLAKSC